MREMLRKLSPMVFQTRRDVVAGVVLIVLTLVAAAAEVVAIGLVMPFLAVLQDPAGSLHRRFVSTAFAALHVTTPEGAIVSTGVALAVAFVAKNAFLAVFGNWQYGLMESRLRRLLRQLMAAYMRQRYVDFTLRNSATMIQNVAAEAQAVFVAVVAPLLVVLTESVSAFVVGVAVLLLRPDILVVVLGATAAAGYLLVRSVYRATGRWGERKVAALGEMTKWVQQGLGGFKEARVAGAERFFVDAVEREGAVYAHAARVHRVYAQVPRFLFETLGVLALVAVSLGVVWSHAPLTRTLPMLGALAIAAVRLMPSVARVVSALGEVRHFTPSVDAVYADLFGKNAPPPELSDVGPPIELRRELALDHVSLVYPGTDRAAVSDATLTIRVGESIALVGGSGAGKSTFADVLIGILEPTEGSVRVDDRVLDDAGRRTWSRSIGYVPQQVFLCDDTIRRNVALGVADADTRDDRVRSALAAANLLEFVSALRDGLDTVVGERGTRLSGGQRQRIGIARALYREPHVVVFDEATAALDVATEQGVVEAIERLRGQRTIVLIAHRLSTVRGCDRIVVMNAGRIEDVGAWDELVARNATFRNLVRIAEGEQRTDDSARVERGRASAEV